MKNILPGIMLLLPALPALAQESPEVFVPGEVDPTGMIVFAILMVIMIGGFFGYIWLKERKRNRSAK